MSSSQWYAVRTFSQQERTFTTRIEREGLASFCPVEHIEKRQRHPSRRGKVTTGMVTRPLLVGYTLVMLSNRPQDWITLRETRGFLSVVGIEGKPWPIPVHQVHHLRALSNQARYMPKPKQIAAGGQAKVIGGPLVEMLAGKLVKVETITDKRARILLGMLGRDTVEIKLEELEAA